MKKKHGHCAANDNKRQIGMWEQEREKGQMLRKVSEYVHCI